VNGADGISDMAGKAAKVAVERGGRCRDTTLLPFQITTKAIGVTLLFWPFLFVCLRRSETLRLFPTNNSLPNVISTVIVSHRPQYSPAYRAPATELMGTFGSVAPPFPISHR